MLFSSVEWLVIPILTVFLTLLGVFLLLRKLGGDIAAAFTGFITAFKENALDPNVSKAFSLMGTLGGNTKAQNALKDRLAKGYIEKNYGGLKLLADKVLGIDVDEIIEDYGAENVLGAVQSLTQQLGVNGGGLPPGLGLGTAPENPATQQKKWYERR